MNRRGIRGGEDDDVYEAYYAYVGYAAGVACDSLLKKPNHEGVRGKRGT